MNTNEILLICRQLEVSGKTPSVALVKARMSGPKVLPVIVSGIKQYTSMPEEAKANLDQELKTPATKAQSAATQQSQDNSLIKTELAALKKETASLKEEMLDIKQELYLLRNEVSRLKAD